MDKKNYLSLVITGIVEEINFEKETVRFNNEDDIVDIRILLKNDIKKIICGQTIKLYIKFQVDSDDNIEVHGFLDKSERDFIAQFDSVNGIGPKGAASIYETLTAKGMSMRDICFEISIGNYRVLTEAPGIGPKAAQKLIDELKNVITVDENSSILVSDNIQMREAVDTLKSLGFVQSDIDNVLCQIDINAEMQTMDIVQAAIEALQS